MKKKLHYFLLFWALALTSHAAPVHAAPSADDKQGPTAARNTVSPPLVHGLYDYYEISGACEKDLQCDLKGKSCRFIDGNKYDSVTKWRIGWDYGYRKSGGMCSAENFRLAVDIVVRIPAWLHRDSATQPLIDKWEAYIDHVKTHENEHLEKVVQAADDLTQAVSLMPPATTCADLDREIRQLSKSRLKQLEVEQNHYDAETNHGWTQGALFP